MADSSQSLPTLISAAEILAGSESKTAQSPDLPTVLRTRLARVSELLQENTSIDQEDLDMKGLEYATAREALRLLERVQTLVEPNDATVSDSDSSVPLLGNRDIAYIRTLISIVFKWAIEPLINELEVTLPGQNAPVAGEPRIIDLTDRQLDFNDLPKVTIRLLSLIFRSDPSAKIRQGWITTTILSRHPVDILTPCFIVGWAPTPIYESFASRSREIKALSIRIINILRPNEAISAIAMILSSMTPKRLAFPHVPKVCAFLLSKQLRRPEGIRGLCYAVLGGEEEENATSLDGLEHIAKVLITAPASTDPQEYHRFMIPRILALLQPPYDRTVLSHKRAAAFTLSRMLSPSFQHHDIASGILLSLFHDPFLSPTPLSDDEYKTSSGPAESISRMTPVESLQTLQTFLLHTDPSPAEMSALLTPVIPELYTIGSLCHSSKIADPNIRESISALLSTWGRIVSSPDAINGIWKIVSGFGGNWELSMDGFTRSAKPLASPSISLLAAADIQSNEVDINSNPFNLRPDPQEFVAFLKGLGRKDVSSEIFVQLLIEYRELNDNNEEPMRTLLYLQLILQIQTQLSASILERPEHVISFIRHALGSVEVAQAPKLTTKKKGLSLQDLRIVGDDDMAAVGDSDDEDEPELDDETKGLVGGGKDEMVETAITLLLSLLEAHPNLSIQNTHDMDIIDSFLERLTSHDSPTIRQLAREARLVLTARAASTSSASSTRTAPEPESAQAIYQKALKLLQDPIIPIRAHGLQLLRDLVSRPSSAKTKDPLDSALIPGILSIFLQSIQNEESFIFLNAVQGLAAMVDGYGRSVLRGILDVYLVGSGVGASGAGAGAISMSKEELDARTRVGEALNTVVKRCGGVLGAYVDILVPPLLTILRSSHLPTTLRMSTLSILSQCAATNTVALSPYSTSLMDTCVEILQLESVAAKTPQKSPNDKTVPTDESHKNDAKESIGGDTKRVRHPDLMDTDPTTKVTKAAPLRRSTLHLLSQLFRAQTEVLYAKCSSASSSSLPRVKLAFPEGGINIGRVSKDEEIPESLLRRAAIVLGYVAATDEDGVTRVMAREVLEFAEQYKEARLGF